MTVQVKRVPPLQHAAVASSWDGPQADPMLSPWGECLLEQWESGKHWDSRTDARTDRQIGRKVLVWELGKHQDSDKQTKRQPVTKACRC
jgi:hypothetical protein